MINHGGNLQIGPQPHLSSDRHASLYSFFIIPFLHFFNTSLHYVSVSCVRVNSLHSVHNLKL